MTGGSPSCPDYQPASVLSAGNTKMKAQSQSPSSSQIIRRHVQQQRLGMRELQREESELALRVGGGQTRKKQADPGLSLRDLEAAHAACGCGMGTGSTASSHCVWNRSCVVLWA